MTTSTPKTGLRTRRLITMQSIRANALADWYEREANELRETGDCDMHRLAGEYDERADELRSAQ